MDTVLTAARQSAFAHEVGGILLGSYRGDYLHITDATTPQRGDRWSPVRFWRSPEGHQQIAESVWERSRGAVTYIGEWHSHAETTPRPSVIDRASWRETLRSQNRPLAFFIQGTDGTCLTLATSLGRCEILSIIDHDDRGVLFGRRASAPQVSSRII